MAVLSDTNLRPVPGDLKKQNKNKNNNKKNNTNKQKQGPVPLTCAWLHYFPLFQNGCAVVEMAGCSLSTWQARSYDLFLEGVGPPKKDLLTKKLFEPTLLGP